MAVTDFTLKKKQLFLDSLSLSGGNVAKACQAASVSRPTVYNHRESDPEFAAQWAETQEAAIADLEQEARRRAFDGTSEPIYYKGEKIGTVQKYSDLLLIFLLKAHKPDVYREHKPSPLELDAAIERQLASLGLSPVGDSSETPGFPTIG